MCRTFFLMGIVLFHLYTLCIVSLTIVDNKELPTREAPSIQKIYY